MRHMLFGTSATENLSVAVLIKESAFFKSSLEKFYVNPLVKAGLSRDNIIAFDLPYGDKKKPSAKLRKEYLTELVPYLQKLNIKTLLVADTEYFKTITKISKVDPHLGYVVEAKYEGLENFDVVLSSNYQAIKYNPLIQDKLDVSIQTIRDNFTGSYTDPGSDIIHFEAYPLEVDEIAQWLDSLHQYQELTVDIEAFSLKFFQAGLGTIGFAWDKHNGISFPVDYCACDPYQLELWDTKDKKFKQYKAYAEAIVNQKIRDLIKNFFETYKGKMTWHNASYDLKVLVYVLWMKDLADYEGMLNGIEIVTRLFDDTKLITYLATNNTAENVLGLKKLSQEFAGNYAQDNINDIRLIPQDDLLTYNLIDCLCTWYVKEQYFGKMVQDEQEEIYQTLFIPSVKFLLQVELTGMPIDPIKVQSAKIILQGIVDKNNLIIQSSPHVKDFHYAQLEKRAAEESKKLKTKDRYVEDYIGTVHEFFNPGSPKQLAGLLYDYLGFPVIDTTDTGEPATGAKVLKKLINHTEREDYQKLLKAFIELAGADKIISSFIPAFEEAQQLPDGSYRLYGNFNLGGTISGRLSSSNPNLQNIPSGSTYAKIIKKCFVSSHGWLFVGADYAALEDRVNALLTKDPEKLKIYCGHTVYKLIINNTEHHIRDDTIIEYDGKIYTGDKFYEMYASSSF